MSLDKYISNFELIMDNAGMEKVLMVIKTNIFSGNKQITVCNKYSTG